MAGSLADAAAGLEVLAADRELHHGLEPAELPAPAAQHLRDRALEHDRRRVVVRARGVWLREVPLSLPERALRDPACDDHAAVPGHAPAAVRDLHLARLERHVAAADHPPLLRERLQRLPVAAVLHVD